MNHLRVVKVEVGAIEETHYRRAMSEYTIVVGVCGFLNIHRTADAR